MPYMHPYSVAALLTKTDPGKDHIHFHTLTYITLAKAPTPPPHLYLSFPPLLTPPAHIEQYCTSTAPLEVSTAIFAHQPIRHAFQTAPYHVPERCSFLVTPTASPCHLKATTAQSIAHTHTGTKIGDPLADIAFKPLHYRRQQIFRREKPPLAHMGRLDQSSRAQLVLMRRTSTPSSPASTTSSPPSTPTLTLLSATTSPHAIRDIFYNYRLTINFAHGKTELLFTHTGRHEGIDKSYMPKTTVYSSHHPRKTKDCTFYFAPPRPAASLTMRPHADGGLLRISISSSAPRRLLSCRHRPHRAYTCATAPMPTRSRGRTAHR